MSVTVDHEERRTQIIDGVLRLAAREGLRGVSMRAAAASAGVSLRLVQYYFGTKNDLLAATLTELTRRSDSRWRRRIEELGADATPREMIEAYIDEALPTDEESRRFHLVYRDYLTLTLTGDSVERAPFVAGPRDSHRRLTGLLDDARAAGELNSDRDPATEAWHVIALEHGLSTALLLGLHTAESAKSVVDHHLDRLFTHPDRPAPHAVG